MTQFNADPALQQLDEAVQTAAAPQQQRNRSYLDIFNTNPASSDILRQFQNPVGSAGGFGGPNSGGPGPRVAITARNQGSDPGHHRPTDVGSRARAMIQAAPDAAWRLQARRHHGCPGSTLAARLEQDQEHASGLGCAAGSHGQGQPAGEPAASKPWSGRARHRRSPLRQRSADGHPRHSSMRCIRSQRASVASPSAWGGWCRADRQSASIWRVYDLARAGFGDTTASSSRPGATYRDFTDAGRTPARKRRERTRTIPTGTRRSVPYRRTFATRSDRSRTITVSTSTRSRHRTIFGQKPGDDRIVCQAAFVYCCSRGQQRVLRRRLTPCRHAGIC